LLYAKLANQWLSAIPSSGSALLEQRLFKIFQNGKIQLFASRVRASTNN
jgi:hypothetical protein